jgi:hypothetical protein
MRARTQVFTAEKKIKIIKLVETILDKQDRKPSLSQLNKELNPTAGPRDTTKDDSDAAKIAQHVNNAVSDQEDIAAEETEVGSLRETAYPYVAGYCVFKATKGVECKACAQVFVIPKTPAPTDSATAPTPAPADITTAPTPAPADITTAPTPAPADTTAAPSKTFFDRIDRGGLVRPSDASVLAISRCSRVWKKLRSEVTAGKKSSRPPTEGSALAQEFLRAGNQRYRLHQIYVETLQAHPKFAEPFFADCKVCGESRKVITDCALARFVNITLNNFTRRLNDQIKHNATKQGTKRKRASTTGDDVVPEKSQKRRKLMTLTKTKGVPNLKG